MSNRPCKVLGEAMGYSAKDTSSKINGWETFIRINKNATEKFRVRGKGDILSPHEGLGMVVESLNVYNKLLNNRVGLTHLGNTLAKETKKILEPLVKSIVKGDTVDLSKYKKATQSLGKDLKLIESEIKKGSVGYIKNDIVNAGVYYMATVVNKYMESYGEMLNTIKEYNVMREKGFDVYKHDMTSEAKGLLLGAFNNMANIFDSVNDIDLFTSHAVKGDFLRFLHKFNDAPLEGIADLSRGNIEESRKRFFELFNRGLDDGSISNEEYINLISSFNGEYSIAAAILPEKARRGAEATVRTLADIRRFSNSTLNLPMGIFLFFGSMSAYTVKAISDFSLSLYNTGGMQPLYDVLGIEKSNIWQMMTRADLNDLTSAGIGSGELSVVNRIADWIKRKTPEQLQKLGFSEFTSKGISEGLGEILKGFHNLADTMSKDQILGSAALHSLRKHGFQDKETFMNYFAFLKESEQNALRQAIIEDMEDYIQFDSGFYGTPTRNISTFMRGKFTRFMMYLSSWGINMMKNTFNKLGGEYVGKVIDGLRGKLGKNWKEDLIKELSNDPKLLTHMKYYYWTMFLGHKTQMAMDDEGGKNSELEDALKSRGTFGRWSNNYMQAIESNREGRLGLSIAESYQNPYLENNKILGAIAGGFKQFNRDFMGQLKGSQLAIDIATNAADGLMDGGIGAMREEGWDAAKKGTQGFNRYFIDSLITELGSNSVPMEKFDEMSVLFGKRLNSIQELQDELRQMSDIEILKNDPKSFVGGVILYNNVLGKAVQSFLNLASSEEKRNTDTMDIATKEMISEFDSSGLFEKAQKGYMPIGSDVSPDIKEQYKRNDYVAKTLHNMGINTDNKYSTIYTMFSEPGNRNQSGYGSDYIYSEMKGIADKILTSEMDQKTYKELVSIYEGGDKGAKSITQYAMLVNYVDREIPGGGAAILSLLAGKVGEAYDRATTGKKYVSSKDLSAEQINNRNELIVGTVGQLMYAADLPTYTNVMVNYISSSDKYKGLNRVLEQDNVKTQLYWTEKAILTAAVKIGEGESAESIYYGTDITSALRKIEDDDLKSATLLKIVSDVNTSNLSDDAKLALKAGMRPEAKKIIYRGMKEPRYFEQHKDYVLDLMGYFEVTYQQLQLLMDNNIMYSNLYNNK